MEPPSCRANHLLFRVQEDYGLCCLDVHMFYCSFLTFFATGENTALSNLSVNLLQHTTHNMPRRDTEHLVRQGYLSCEVVGDPHCSGRGQWPLSQRTSASFLYGSSQCQHVELFDVAVITPLVIVESIHSTTETISWISWIGLETTQRVQSEPYMYPFSYILWS